MLARRASICSALTFLWAFIPIATTMRSKSSSPRSTIDAWPMVKGSNDPAKIAVRGRSVVAGQGGLVVDFAVIFNYQVVDYKVLTFAGVFAKVEFD